MSTAEEIAKVREELDRACEAEGRDPATLPLSMMTGWLIGADEAELHDRAARLAEWKGAGGNGKAFLVEQRPSTIKSYLRLWPILRTLSSSNSGFNLASATVRSICGGRSANMSLPPWASGM